MHVTPISDIINHCFLTGIKRLIHTIADIKQVRQKLCFALTFSPTTSDLRDARYIGEIVLSAKVNYVFSRIVDVGSCLG